MAQKQQRLWDYFILCTRLLLAYIFLDYGIGKLTGHQFGLNAEELSLPVKDMNLFRLSWYMFDQEPFRTFIGISQIIAALLLLFNRTVIAGALLFLPILANILIVDIAFLKDPALYWRISYYIILDLLILWHQKDRVLPALKIIFSKASSKLGFPVWAYLIIPLMLITLEFLSILPQIVIDYIKDPHFFWAGVKQLLEVFSK